MITCNGKCRKGALDLDCTFHSARCGKPVFMPTPGFDGEYHGYGQLLPCRLPMGHDEECDHGFSGRIFDS